MTTILYAGAAAERDTYLPALAHALREAGVTGARVTLPGEVAPAEVDYLVYAPNGPVQDFTPFSRARAVLSLWAGVERVVSNPTLTQPLCRMVDEGLERGMVEWVTGQVLSAHLGLDRVRAEQDGRWRHDAIPPLATERPVTILGLGALGAAAARMLAALGFPVTGWSRSPKDIPGIRCLHGAAGLPEALSGAQIVATILPDTAETRNILNTETLAMLPMGAVVLNPGRGPLIDDAALLAALETGRVGHAVLDVFRTEPLPPDHPYWAHPRVTVSPHVAAATRPASAARAIADNIRLAEAGQPLRHLVDRIRGY